jgi:hypothetical protein
VLHSSLGFHRAGAATGSFALDRIYRRRQGVTPAMNTFNQLGKKELLTGGMSHRSTLIRARPWQNQALTM